jgi:lipid-A-disaccharide synthase
MLHSALANVGDGLRVLSKAGKCFAREPVRAAVVIDSPTLNLPLAKSAKRHGLPVLYYIAPQVWAWARYRVRKVRRRVDKLAVILPFEETFFRGHGLDATYVGHPLFDTLAARQPDPAVRRAIHAAGQPVVALVPGSRKHVVQSLFADQLEICRAVAARYPQAHFPVSVANDTVRRIIEPAAAASGLNVALYEGKNADVLETADLVLVASGTSTLEVAYYLRPMVVMYKASRLLYHLVGRWLIHTKQFSLVNVLAGRALVPEFMPYYTSTDPIAARALALLDSADERAAMSRSLSELLHPMIKTGAAEATARMLLDMVRQNVPHVRR